VRVVFEFVIEITSDMESLFHYLTKHDGVIRTDSVSDKRDAIPNRANTVAQYDAAEKALINAGLATKRAGSQVLRRADNLKGEAKKLAQSLDDSEEFRLETPLYDPLVEAIRTGWAQGNKITSTMLAKPLVKKVLV